MAIDFYLFANSSDSVTINPEYDDYEEKRTKQQSLTRSTVGTGYHYTFGTYNAFELSLKFINSSDTCRINSWWGASTTLNFMEDGKSPVAVKIVNGTLPLNSRISPYTDLFQGSLELEEF